MNVYFTFVFEEPHHNRLVDLALAVTCARQSGYNPVVYTNLALNLPATFVPTECKPTRLWTTRKFATYALAPDGDPYLHIDSDVFLLRPLPLWFLNSPLFVQTDHEPKEWYGHVDLFPDEWKTKFMPNPWRAMCMGVFGGDPALVRAYAAFSELASPECAGKWRGHVISEQATLGRFVQDHGVRVASLSPTLDRFPEGYQHLMARKDSPAARRWVERTLRDRDPDLAATLLPDRGPAVLFTAPKITAGTVRRFYQGTQPKRNEQLTRVEPEVVTVTMGAGGLGDCIALTDLERAARSQGREARVYANSPHWDALMEHCPGHRPRKFSWSFDALHEIGTHGAGNGHVIQRIRRLCGLHVHPVPSGSLEPKGKVGRIKNRVCFHFEPSPGWSAEQSRSHHPRARKLSPRVRAELLALVDQLPHNFTYIEVGGRPLLQHPLVEDGTGRPLEDTIRLMAECEYHVGIDSGPMHLATALGLKVICILNFPDPDKLMLPVLVSTNIDEAWLYPQNVHLHQDVDSPHIPLADRKSLLLALQGEVYPYWSTDVASQLEGEMQ